ncbi:hypothetical protein SAMN04488589_0015 [Methanolobus vulcani]|jgi:hypothetical protein|uniref:Uncharacterized protein n=1 Tax=Methanolobus vulcani TaxID=38026 RepID=A0A7Z7AU35_9EURY|nr:hypothetical protein [Methanolobus vulcani]MDK2948689.1 hypothetical protein [Methanolobus sp.]SDF21870.1 hypothetical protein SAMN04488589_0015 [Methanolobus vulcani]
MLRHKEKTKANLYGIKGMHNVYSWQGLAIHFKNSSRVMKCEAYETCHSDKRSRACFYSTKRPDAIYMLQSGFNVSITVAEKLIDTLVDMGVTKALRCRKVDSSGFCDEGCRMLAFEEDI